MNWKMILPIALSLVLVLTTIYVAFENANLNNNNIQLIAELQSAQQKLDEVNKSYLDLKELFEANQKGDISPPIETRLGIKVMNGIRTGYPNYLWITGQVENVGNLTLYNAKLRFTLYATNGTDVREHIIGTMQSQQTVDVRYSAYTSLGAITNWKLKKKQSQPIDHNPRPLYKS